MKHIGFKNEAFEIIGIAPESEQTKSKKQYIVKCRKCGRIFYKSYSDVKKYKGKGCMECTPRYFESSKPNDWHLYIHYRKHAEDKHREFQLSYEEFKELVHSNCHYCGAEPSYYKMLEKYSKNSELQKLNGVDRKDSSLGYTKENCVPCCPLCNHMKSDLSYQTFIQQVRKIYNSKTFNDYPEKE